MGRRPCCNKETVNKGAWTPQEDQILANYISLHGHGNWRSLAQNAGLNRCGKSCRLRWMNYLRPDIKRGAFTEDEDDLIIRLHRLLGNRWALISRRIPGRTDNEIKNHWNSNLIKKVHPHISWPYPRTTAPEPILKPLSVQEGRYSAPDSHHYKIFSDLHPVNNDDISPKDDSTSSSSHINNRSSTTSEDQNPLNSSMDLDKNKDFFLDLLLEIGENNITQINNPTTTNYNNDHNSTCSGKEIIGGDDGDGDESNLVINKSCHFQENKGEMIDSSCDMDTTLQPMSTFLSELKKVASFLELEDHEWED